MNCQEARNLFEEAIDHALAGARKRKFDLHLQRCSSCRALYDTEVREHTELFRAFKDFSAEALPSHSQMVARLVAAHRPATRLPWYRRMPRWMKFAAALVLCVGTVALARQITDLVVERNAFKDNEETEEPGAVLINAKIISDLMGKLSGEVFLYEEGKEVFVKSGDLNVYNMPKMNVDDYPAFPELDAKEKIEMTDAAFNDLVYMTEFACATDHSRIKTILSCFFSTL